MKIQLWTPVVVLSFLAACGGESSQAPAATTPAQSSEVADETLPTPEEEAAKASETIDEGNADAELKKLEQELGGG